MSARLRHLPAVWAVLLTLVMLAPVLAPGYVLSYDLVWVPHLDLRSDFLGFSTSLPRAVPSDVVVAVLDQVIPAQLLEKLALVAPPIAAALGMARLVGESLVARLTAVTLTVWNPFVVERLLIGHWTVLVGYGVLPWLVLAGRAARRTGRLPALTWALVPLGSLSASAGIVSAVALLVSGWRSPRRVGRTDLVLAACALAGNAPWIMAGLLHAGSATGGGASVFALHPEGSLPAPLAALGMGGIWNADVVPDSRHSFLSWISLVVLIALAATGLRAWREHNRGEAARLVTLWVVGMLAALVTWLLPGAVDSVAAHLPGGGLVRDGTRFFALCLPMYAGLPSAGAETLARELGPSDRAVRGMVAGVVALLVVLPLYDAAWGVSGALRPVDYPASWARVRAEADLAGGDVLILPLSAYRAPSWNSRRTVLDPLGRYLSANYLADDSLLVDDRTVPGEDPRIPEVRRALQRGSPQARTDALVALGIRSVATETDVAGTGRDVELDADVVAQAPGLRIQRLRGDVTDRTPGTGDTLLMSLAWAAYLASFVGGVIGAARSGRARWRASRRSPVP